MRTSKHERATGTALGVGVVDHNPLGERACQALDRTVKELRRAQGRAGELATYPALYRSQQLPLPDGPGLGRVD